MLISVSKIRVLYADTDQMGVVNNVVYLRYFEAGRCEWLRAQGRPYKDVEASGLMFPIVEANLRYRESARYDDVIDVRCGPAELRAASFRFEYELRRQGDGALLCSGWTLHACTTTAGKLRRLPDDILSLLKQS